MDKQRNERRFLTRHDFFAQSSAADEIHDSKLVSRLKNFRETIDWNNEAERDQFRRQLNPLIKNWKGQLPNLRDIFGIKEIDWLLAEAVKSDDNRTKSKPLINFVIRAGYKDEPKIDRYGKPLPRRTTAVHHAFGQRTFYYGGLIRKLFKIYNVFDVDYIDEFGLTHFHVACKHGLNDIVEKFLERGLNPNCVVPETGDSPLHLILNYRAKKIRCTPRLPAPPRLSRVGIYLRYGVEQLLSLLLLDFDASALGEGYLQLALQHGQLATLGLEQQRRYPAAHKNTHTYIITSN
ncbi:unnamed protein product [Trichogramma brassicae]|uniref:Uncharacterized protein n=1 Tax=Trichogramma brassicae TaxID=86971 RepID=A0A6H5HVQ5_9HYME|nr:unnamed protein product [Trichogramma brassicae]